MAPKQPLSKSLREAEFPFSRDMGPGDSREGEDIPGTFFRGFVSKHARSMLAI